MDPLEHSALVRSYLARPAVQKRVKMRHEKLATKSFVARQYNDYRKLMPAHETRKWRERKPEKIKRIVVHCTGSKNQNPVRTARYHISANNHIWKGGCPGICYHDFVTENGFVNHCTDYNRITYHCRGWNKDSLGVVMAYPGQDGKHPVDAQYVATVEHCAWLCLKFKLHPNRVRGHREAPSVVFFDRNGSKRLKKLCPGRAIDLVAMRDYITRKMQISLRDMGLYEGRIDGIFGRKSKRALRQVNL